MFSRRKFLPITLVGSLCAIFGINSCGIYTVSKVLDPPYGQQIGSNSLTFSGNITEVSGYMLWYKEVGSDVYSMCIHKGRMEVPTIPEDLAAAGLPSDWIEYDIITYDPDPPNEPIIVEYTVYFDDLKPLVSIKTFSELKDLGNQYYFAVSSYGTDGEESEKTEFGIWPPS